jgi:nitric oxide reductase NorD protein
MSGPEQSIDRPLSAAVIEERFEDLVGAVLSSRRTAAGISQRLAGEPRALQDFVLHWAAVTAKTNPELAYQFAALSADAVAALGTAGAERWLLAAMDVYDHDGLYRASAALKDLDGYAARARETAYGVSFEEVASVLELFVTGLAGRRLRLAVGEPAWTDTATLYLPARIALYPTRAENFRLYKLTAALLWAQTRYGTYNLEAAAYPEDAPALGRFALLEALRVGARLGRVLPGLARDLSALAQPALGPEFDAARDRLERAEASAADSVRLAGQIAASASWPRWPFIGAVDPARALAVRAERVARETAALREALLRLRGELQPGEGAPGADDAEAAAADADLGLRLEVSASDERIEVSARIDGRLLAPPPEVARLAESLFQDLGALPEGLRRAAGEGARRPGAEAASEGEDGAAPEDAQALHYDEWDYRRQQYRKAWCALRERDVHPGDPAFVERTVARYRAQIAGLRRSFEALRGEDKRLRAQRDGDDIDFDAVVRASAELRAGAELDPRLFTRRARHARDMAVLFMVDMSGSTKGWINDCEREALVLLAEALEVLGDRYAIYGFSGVTRRRCEVYRIKRFDEPYGQAVRERIAGILPLDYTRMGAAIRHLTGILSAVDARTRLLVTLSDGKPDDFSDGYRGEYGIEDTRQALIEAKRAGVHSFCITIDRDAASYLPRMYGAVNYTVIEDVARLPVKVAEVYRRLTT